MRVHHQGPLSSLLLTVVSLLCAMSTACANGIDAYDLESLKPGERALVKLPLSFEVGPNNRLYVYGERVDSVNLSIGSGDTLLLNGKPIEPRLQPPPRDPEVVEVMWRRVGREIPFVQEKLAGGASAADAGEQWEAEVLKIRSLLFEEYREHRARGLSEEGAAAAAFSRLEEFDVHQLIDWSRRNSVEGSTVTYSTKGISLTAHLALEDILLAESSPPAKARHSTLRDKLRLATELYESLVLGPGPCWYILSWGGTTVLCGEDSVALALAQVAKARETGEEQDGVLPADLASRIAGQEESR